MSAGFETVLFAVGLLAGVTVIVRVGAVGVFAGLALAVSIPGARSVAFLQVLAPLALVAELARIDRSRGRQVGQTSGPLGFATVAFVVWITLSVLWTIDFGATIKALTLLASGAAGLYSLQLYGRRRGMYSIWGAWFILGLVQATTALAWWGAGRPARFDLQSVSSPLLIVSQDLRLGHPFLGLSSYYASFCILFVVPAVCRIGPQAIRLASGAANAIALALTVSRGGILATITGVAIALLLTVRSPRRAFGWILAGSATAVAAVHYVFSRRSFSGSSFLADPARATLRSISFGIIHQHVLKGSGYGSWVAFPSIPQGTHNYLLTIWLETGIVGLILFLCCNVLFFARMWRCSDRQMRGAAIGLFVAVWFDIVVEASLEGVYFELQILLLIGILLGMPKRRPRLLNLSAPFALRTLVREVPR